MQKTKHKKELSKMKRVCCYQDKIQTLIQNKLLWYFKFRMLASSDQKVIQLVGIREHERQLYLTEEGKAFLQSIDAPVSVITIAGLYRTGKSYLVNQLLSKLNVSSQPSKFAVGDTVQSCTKGLNVWAVPFQQTLPRQKFYYIIVDSQGIGSMEQEQNYDINLLMLIFLISSTVIYNSVGAIDEQSLDQLRVIVNLKKAMGEKPTTQPRFVWVLRDFALQLINKKGDEMTPDQYLEDCLEVVNSSNKQIAKKNEIRTAIKQSLPNRQCHTLVRPTIKQHDLSNLNALPKSKLRKQFIDQVDFLYQSIFTHSSADIKYLNHESNLVDGAALVKMIEYYLSEINCNKIPEVRSVWELIQATKFQEIMEECESELKRQTLKIDLPLGEEELKQRLNQIQNKIFGEFERKFAPSDVKGFKKFNQNFLKLTHKINTKMRKGNQQIKRKKELRRVRQTINREIEFDSIDPCQISNVRQVIQKLQLKAFGDVQIYEYVLGSVLDVMEIAQEKSVKMREEVEVYERNQKVVEMDKKGREEEMMRVKREYHDALKEISTMKGSQVDDVRDLAVTKQQLELIQGKLAIVEKEKQEKEEELRKKVEELSEKMRRKQEESLEAMKSLRAQNQSLTAQLEQAKQQLNHQRQLQRKETTFEDKIKQSWDRFEEERAYFKKQLEKFKQLHSQSEEKTKFLLEKEQILQTTIKRERQTFGRKEREFCQQLKWMKENYSKTKDAYNQSYNTRIENQQILKDITQGAKKKTIQNENTTHLNDRHSNFTDRPSNFTERHSNFTERHSNLNDRPSNLNDRPSLSPIDKASLQQVTSTCQTLKIERLTLQREMATLQTKLQKQKNQMQQLRQFYEKKVDKLEERASMLQNSNQGQKERFYSCLKELEQAKESERQMYEDSIMRLLNNMDSYEPMKTKSRNLENVDSYEPMKSKSRTLQKQAVSSSYNKTKKYLY